MIILFWEPTGVLAMVWVWLRATAEFPCKLIFCCVPEYLVLSIFFLFRSELHLGETRLVLTICACLDLFTVFLLLIEFDCLMDSGMGLPLEKVEAALLCS